MYLSEIQIKRSTEDPSVSVWLQLHTTWPCHAFSKSTLNWFKSVKRALISNNTLTHKPIKCFHKYKFNKIKWKMIYCSQWTWWIMASHEKLSIHVIPHRWTFFSNFFTTYNNWKFAHKSRRFVRIDISILELIQIISNSKTENKNENVQTRKWEKQMSPENINSFFCSCFRSLWCLWSSLACRRSICK